MSVSGEPDVLSRRVLRLPGRGADVCGTGRKAPQRRVASEVGDTLSSLRFVRVNLQRVPARQGGSCES